MKKNNLSLFLDDSSLSQSQFLKSKSKLNEIKTLWILITKEEKQKKYPQSEMYTSNLIECQIMKLYNGLLLDSFDSILIECLSWTLLAFVAIL